ncbi:MAG: hypothetical protein ACI8PZ_003217 [Myxococcota bacterium]|jgi:hypothetical protein
MPAPSSQVAFPVDPPDDGDGLGLTLRHDGWRVELFTLHTPHAFRWWALGGAVAWVSVTALVGLNTVFSLEDPALMLLITALSSAAAAQLALLPLGAMLVLRVRYLELGKGRLFVAGILGAGISVPLEAITAAWADGEDLMIQHAERGELRFPLRAGSELLRQWLAQSIDEAARRTRDAPRDAVPDALRQMIGEAGTREAITSPTNFGGPAAPA